MFERSCQVKVVGAAARYSHTHTVAVDALDVLQRRVPRHRVDAFNHRIGRSEVDLDGAHRVDRQKDDVQGSGLERIEDFAGRIKSHVLDGKAELAGKFAGKIARYSAWGAAGRVRLGQHRVAEIDRDAQPADGSQLGDDRGGNFFFGHKISFDPSYR